MAEAPDIIYGRLLESAHHRGHAQDRCKDWMESLLTGDDWQHVGPGFTDINAFLRTVHLSPGDEWAVIAARIRELQPDASVRAIAQAIGKPPTTVQDTLKPPGVRDRTAAPAPGPADQAPAGAPVRNRTPGPGPAPAGPEPGTLPAPGPGVSGTGEDTPPWAGDEDPAGPGDEPDAEDEASAQPHVSRNAGDHEWYSPAEYIKAALAVMGAIDLDPASSAEANEVVGAAEFYDADDDGLHQPWHGQVWMNPPYAQPAVDRFCARLAREYAAGNVTEACVLVNNATETAWFQAVLAEAVAVCFPRGRVKFWHPRKEATPLQGQAVLYLGANLEAFRAEFTKFGPVLFADLWRLETVG